VNASLYLASSNQNRTHMAECRRNANRYRLNTAESRANPNGGLCKDASDRRVVRAARRASNDTARAVRLCWRLRTRATLQRIGDRLSTHSDRSSHLVADRISLPAPRCFVITHLSSSTTHHVDDTAPARTPASESTEPSVGDTLMSRDHNDSPSAPTKNARGGRFLLPRS